LTVRRGLTGRILDTFEQVLLAVTVRRLQDRLHLLQCEAGDLPESRQSLEAAIGWSYDLLTEADPKPWFGMLEAVRVDTPAQAVAVAAREGYV